MIFRFGKVALSFSETFTYYWTKKKVECIVSYINQKVIAFRKVMNINVAFSCQTMVKNRLQPCCHAVLLSDNFTITDKYRKVLFVISSYIYFCSIRIKRNRSCFEDLQIIELPTPSDITERVDLNETRLLKLELRLGGSVSDVTEYEK